MSPRGSGGSVSCVSDMQVIATGSVGSGELELAYDSQLVMRHTCVESD